MIRVIGKNNCSRCDMTKNILDNKGVQYEYIKLEDCESEVKKEYLTMARKVGQMEMPLIIKDNNIVTLQEVV